MTVLHYIVDALSLALIVATGLVWLVLADALTAPDPTSAPIHLPPTPGALGFQLKLP
jgi:hypothetical protein